MRPVVLFVLSAALALTLRPGFAQSPGAATMPAGAQNPALVQPRLVPAPGGPLSQPSTYQPGPQPSGYQPGPQPSGYQPGPQPGSAQQSPYQPGPQPSGYQPGPQPSGFQPGPTPNQPAPSALIGPEGAGGLCECLINHDPKLSVFDKTKMHQRCMGSPEACRAACETDRYFSFVPHAIFTCPGPSGPATGHIAMNTRPAVRLLSRR